LAVGLTAIPTGDLPTDISSNLVSIVIDKIKLVKPQLAIGVSSFDLSTGHGSYYESYSTMDDPLYALDDIKRYFESFEPSEIILYYTLTDEEEINNMNIKNILNYLGFSSNILIFNYNKYSTNTIKLSYQKIILEKVFNNIFEILNLHLYNFARLSLVNLLEYTKNHQNNLLNKLKLPTEFENDKILFLGNDALNQLDIFHKNGLFSIINHTKTIIGKRLLENNLKKPLINKLEIEERLNLIDKLLNNNLSDYLENIGDLERLIRKIELETLQPTQLNNLYVSFYQIDKLIEYLKKNHLIDSFNIQYDNVKILLDYINNTFYLDKLNNIDNSYFKSNIYKDIDLLQDKIDSSNNFMNNLVIVLEKIITDEKIYLKYNDRDGHYLILTNRRCSVLQSKLEKMNEINVGSIKLKVEDLEFNQLPKSSNTKISCKKIKEISNEIVIYKTEINKLLKEKFKEQLNYILDNFGAMINYWSNKIGFIDFINSGAICAINNKYIKPTLVDYKESYFKISGLRHAVVEQINTTVSYKTHDIALGGVNELNGILLFGINGSGKSTLMKAIGICIIMAQIGYYVPASNLELSVYKSLLTRISSNDNIYKTYNLRA
jgi:DNA mismatch repair protein MutS